MFDNYVTALSEEDIAVKTVCFAYSLLGYRGTEDFFIHSPWQMMDMRQR